MSCRRKKVALTSLTSPYLYCMKLISLSFVGCFTEVSLMVRTTFGIPVFNDNTGSPMNTLIFFSKMAAALSCVFKAAINDCLPRQIRPSGRTLNLIHKMRSFHRQYKKAAGQIKPNNTRITSTDLSLQDFMSSPEQKGKIGKEENIPYLREETFHGRRRKGMSW